MDAEACRKSVDALKHQVDALERLANDEASSMSTIVSKATQAVAAQQSASIGFALQAASAAIPAAGGAKHQQRRPAPPPSHSARPLSYARRDGGAATNVCVPEQRTGSSTTRNDSIRTAAARVICSELIAQGWDSDAATAAVNATHSVSRDAAEGWLASMPNSHKTKPKPLTTTAHGAPTVENDAVRLQEQQPRSPQQQQHQPQGAGGSAIRAARLIHRRGVVPQPTPASARSVSAAISQEPTLCPFTNHNVASQAVAEHHELPETEIWRAPVVSSAVPTSSPLRRVAVDPAAQVAIQVRGPDGTTNKIGKTFRPHDSLKSVVVEYLRVHPMHPMPCFSAFRVVVPWLRTSYQAHVLERVTLADASLCPTATIVLQVDSFKRRQ